MSIRELEAWYVGLLKRLEDAERVPDLRSYKRVERPVIMSPSSYTDIYHHVLPAKNCHEVVSYEDANYSADLLVGIAYE